MSKWNVRCAIHLEKTIGFFRKNRYRWLFALSLLSVTVCLFFLVFLPDTIPVHYDASWQVDRYGLPLQFWSAFYSSDWLKPKERASHKMKL